MNPFIESTVAQPQQGAAAQWPKPAGADPAPQRPACMARFLRRRPRAAPSGARPGGRGAASLKRLAGQAVMALGLVLGGSGTAWAVDVNSATQEALQTIRGIGPKTAQAIVDERTRGGAFESFDDLSERVKGIGAKKTQSLQAAGLTLSKAAAADKPVARPPGVQR